MMSSGRVSMTSSGSGKYDVIMTSSGSGHYSGRVKNPGRSGRVKNPGLRWPGRVKNQGLR